MHLLTYMHCERRFNTSKYSIRKTQYLYIKYHRNILKNNLKHVDVLDGRHFMITNIQRTAKGRHNKNPYNIISAISYRKTQKN
jgi:hypothetical protein